MSVTANDKGGAEQRVNLVKRGKGEIQHVMLNSTLIKKAENYGLMTDRFITNHFAPVMQDARTLITFHPRRKPIKRITSKIDTSQTIQLCKTIWQVSKITINKLKLNKIKLSKVSSQRQPIRSYYAIELYHPNRNGYIDCTR